MVEDELYELCVQMLELLDRARERVVITKEEYEDALRLKKQTIRAKGRFKCSKK